MCIDVQAVMHSRHRTTTMVRSIEIPRFQSARIPDCASVRNRNIRHCEPHHGEAIRSEEHTSELQSLMRISYAVFCLKKKKKLQPVNQHIYKNVNIYKTKTTM